MHGKHDEIAPRARLARLRGPRAARGRARARRRRCSPARSPQSIDGATFARIQCTPDLQPTDVTGLAIYNQKTRDFEFRPGPVFANVVLVDEINRAMPKTQSALLEAMAERQVTVDGVTRPLPDPFLVIATENPIEQEGTFPLPEAQLDRFSLRTSLGYPALDDEVQIVEEQRHGHPLGAPRARGERRRGASAAEGGRGGLRRRADPALARRARARDAAARGRLDRRLGPRQPRARARPRAHGRSSRGASTSCPRTSRSSSCRCSATASSSRPRSSPRPAASAVTRRARAIRARSFELAPRPGRDDDLRRARRQQRLGTASEARGARSRSSRAAGCSGCRSASSAAPGAAPARTSSAAAPTAPATTSPRSTGTPRRSCRPRATTTSSSSAALRRRGAAGRAGLRPPPAMGDLPAALPPGSRSRRAGRRSSTDRGGAGAGARRRRVARLRASGEAYWLPPRSERLRRARHVDRPFDAPEDTLERGFAYLGGPRDLPTEERSCSSSPTSSSRPPPARGSGRSSTAGISCRSVSRTPSGSRASPPSAGRPRAVADPRAARVPFA